jgi:hypothetical protein
MLFPLSCAFASKKNEQLAIPTFTWTTSILPYNNSFGYSSYLPNLNFKNDINISDMSKDIEEWSRIIDKEYLSSIDVAIKRIVSSVTNRTDPADSLIDAVMAWENLLGTSNEVTFRVSASLAKLIETDITKRSEIKKELSDIYALRSRIVHGSNENQAVLIEKSNNAIMYAILALKTSFKLGKEWLSLKSNERSDQLLLR